MANFEFSADKTENIQHYLLGLLVSWKIALISLPKKGITQKQWFLYLWGMMPYINVMAIQTTFLMIQLSYQLNVVQMDNLLHHQVGLCVGNVYKKSRVRLKKLLFRFVFLIILFICTL